MVRNSSFELLRIISITLIVLCHICALLDWSVALPLNKWVVGGANSIGSFAVCCFVLISGYFGVSFKWKRFIELIIVTTVYCTIVAAFRFGNSPIELLKAFITVPSYSMWFIACYLVLMPLSPFINKFVSQLSVKEFRLLLAIMFVFFSLFPTVTIIGATNGVILRNGGKCLTYFMFLYIVGRYIRLHNDKSYNRWYLWLIHLTCVAIILLLNMVGSTIIHDRCVYAGYDCSPISLMSSLCIFYLFKSWNFHNSFINWVAKSAFAVYLLSNIYFFIDDKYIHLVNYSNQTKFSLYLLILLVLSWIFSLIIDKTIGVLINKGVSSFVDKAKSKVVDSKIYKSLF